MLLITKNKATGGHSYWVLTTFALLAAGLFYDPWSFSSPVEPAARVPAWAVDTAPVRQPKLRPEYTVAGYDYRCNDCHSIIPSPVETYRKLTQHTEIKLKHGINTRCFNCHYRTDRDAFVDDLGKPILWNQSQLVCAKCHGPVYRDWQHGSHGRTNGYWDRSKGLQTRLKCIECHDPHQPAFGPMAPAAGPKTLRMGSQDYSRHTQQRNPLRIHDDSANSDVNEKGH